MGMLRFALIFLSLAWPASASDVLCQYRLQGFEVQGSDTTFMVKVPGRHQGGTAVLHDGALSFFIFFKNDDGSRIPGLRGKEFYAQAMEHFAGRVKTIHDIWPAAMDNGIEFKKQIEQGRTPEQAAFATWSGQRAAEHGFNRVKVTMDRLDSGVLSGVTAVFSRN